MENTEKLEESLEQKENKAFQEGERYDRGEKLKFDKEQLVENIRIFDGNLVERKKERKQSAYSNAMQQLIKQYDGKLDEYTVNSKLEKPDITLLPPIAPTHEDILALAIKIEDYVNS